MVKGNVINAYLGLDNVDIYITYGCCNMSLARYSSLADLSHGVS
jgi:hypothetical protein